MVDNSDINLIDESDELIESINLRLKEHLENQTKEDQELKEKRERYLTNIYLLENIKTRSDENDAQIHSIAGAITELTATLSSNSDQISRAMHIFQESKGNIGKTMINLEKLKVVAQSSKDKIVDTRAKMLAFKDNLDALDITVKNIKEHADKTNLVAITAAIEAEKAGSGTSTGSFTGLAKEMKNNYIEATKNHKALSDNLTSLTNSFQELFDFGISSDKNIEKLSESLNNIMEVTNHINDGLKELSKSFDSITASSLNQEEATIDINQGICVIKEKHNQLFIEIENVLEGLYKDVDEKPES